MLSFGKACDARNPLFDVQRYPERASRVYIPEFIRQLGVISIS